MSAEQTDFVEGPDDTDAGRHCPYQEAVAGDLRSFRRELAARELIEAVKHLEEPSSARTARAIVEDLVIILAAWAACAFGSIYLAPLAVLIIGNRQRSLGNILHDGSHWTLATPGSKNERWMNLLLAPVLFNVTSLYRRGHRDHHRHLGSPKDDPDLIHRDTYQEMSWPRVLALNVISWPTWKGSFLGHLARASALDRVKIVGFWAALLGLLAAAAGPARALGFLALWLVARATVFHVITTFRELNDHAGLEPGSLLGFTRNSPSKGLARLLFHPCNNGYHLLHHFDPRLPFHALPAAHKIAMNLPFYAEAHHCDGYFWGKHPVVSCWRRRCPGRTEASAAR